MASEAAQRIEAELRPDGPDGWWRRATGETVLAVADRLLAAGLDEQAAGDVIASIMGATREEYGE